MESDCSHEIKRHLLLGRKTRTNLDSILKSRHITLLTKVLIVKAMVFPVVMYESDSWDYKESWTQKNWCFRTVVLEKTLQSPLDCKIKPVNSKGNQSWIFIGRTIAEAEAPIFWSPEAKSQLIGKDPDSGKDWRQKKGAAEDKMVSSITNSMDMNLSKLQGIVEDRRAWHATVHGVAKSRTWLSNWTTMTGNSY